MLPIRKFREALQGYKEEMDQQFEELILAADLLSKRANTILREDNGLFYIQAIGTLDEAINTLTVMLKTLEEVKEKRV